MKHTFLYLVLLMGLFVGCTDDKIGPVLEDEAFIFSQNGFFIINEGNFTQGNGSVSFYSFDSAKVYSNVFLGTNSRPLGDVPFKMSSDDTVGIISVNNSSKLEFVSTLTLNSLGTLTLAESPRYTVFVDQQKAYVSDLYSDSLKVINPTTQSIIGAIDLKRSSETMAIANGKLFVACWSQLNHPDKENNMVMVVDINTDQVVDSIVVTKEPNSMVLDAEDNLWVLCSGGYLNEEIPALVQINTVTNSVEQTLSFESVANNPTSLNVNTTGDTLFYLDNGVFAYPVSDAALATTPIISQDDRTFYGLSTVENYVVVSDAADYQQNGMVYVYKRNGEEKTSFRAGINPGSFYAVKP